MNRAEKRRQQKLTRKAGGNSAAAGSADQLVQLGLRLHQAGRLSEAADLYHQALRIAPRHAEALHLSGVTAHQAGRHEEAARLISRAIRENPRRAAYHSHLGLALQALGKLDDAVAGFERAVALDENLASAYSNLGFALQERRQPAAAVAACRKAIALDPDSYEAYCNLGNALRQQGEAREAEKIYRQAIALGPDMAVAHYNLGNVLNDQARPEAAAQSFEKAIALKPDYAKAHCNLASTWKELARLDEAVAAFNTAFELEPESPSAHSNVIFIQDFCPQIDLAAQQAERQSWNEKFILPLGKSIKPHRNDRDPERRLRIGYVSADYRAHSACQGFAPLILDHDRERFDVICYTGNEAQDPMQEKLRAAASEWRLTDGLADDALADTIRKDRIDILVDLSGHTEGNRLLTFGRKPAPVQVTGIGHLAPGVSTIDYRLTTASFTRPDEESLYPEQAVYLNTLFGFVPPAAAPDVADPPRRDGGAITFGCLNRLYKISDDVIALWARILASVPESRLLIKYRGLESPAMRAKFERSFAAHGVAADRLMLLGGSSHRDHLETYHRIDFSLDTFPQGGGITTLESLWMGVPVLGLFEPSKSVNRLVEVLCEPLGLQDWIAASPEAYCRLATGWADRRDDLARLRRDLRRRVADVYFRFPADVEAAYRIMWRRWCAGEPAAAIDVGSATARVFEPA